MKSGNNISRRKFILRSADREPPGHEIVGVVTAIGNNVIKFRVDDIEGHPGYKLFKQIRLMMPGKRF